jgi:hypothetical protein
MCLSEVRIPQGQRAKTTDALGATLGSTNEGRLSYCVRNRIPKVAPRDRVPLLWLSPSRVAASSIGNCP